MGRAGIVRMIGVVAVIASAATAGAQLRVPSPSTRPQGQVFDDLQRSGTRPVPRVPASPAPGVDTRWVPDQRVQVPGFGDVHVPGHWEHRLPSGDVLVPPLTGSTPDGRVVQFPGTRVPPQPPLTTPQAP